MRHICCTMTRIKALPPPPAPPRGGGDAGYGTADSSVSIQLERGYAAWCEIQTKWRSVVGECLCEAVLARPHP